MKKPNVNSNSLADIKKDAQAKGQQQGKKMLEDAKASANTPGPGPSPNAPSDAVINSTAMQPTTTAKAAKAKAAKPAVEKEPEVPQVALPFVVPAIESGYMEVRDVKGDHVLASIDLYRATNLERRNRRPLWIVSFNGSGAPSVLLDATKETMRDGFALALRNLKFPKDIQEAALRQIKAHNTVRDGAQAKAKPTA